MRITWKNWPDIETFLSDNGLKSKSWPKESVPGVKLEETAFSFPNGVILCAVEKVEWANGTVEYYSHFNVRYFADFPRIMSPCFRAKTDALRKGIRDSARYFNADGTPSARPFMCDGKCQADGDIHFLEGTHTVIAADGKPSWING